MKHASRVAFSLLAFVFFVSAMGILPMSARAKKQQASQEPAPAAQTQTVSGKIASVDKASFTLNVTSGAASAQSKQFTNAGPKSMTFQIDKNTTIDGQLKVGATADVTYRQDNGANVAISVHVS